MFKLHYLVYLLIITIGFGAGVYNMRDVRVRPVTVLLGLTVCSETLSNILAHLIRNNVCVYHFFNPIQAAVWGWFFYINSETRLKRTIIPLLTMLLLYAVFNTLFLQNLTHFPGNFIKFEGLFLLFGAFNLFIEFLDRPADENIFNNKVFIISICVIWFNLTSYLFFELFNFFVDHKIPTDSIRAVNYFASYTYYSLLAVAMFLKDKKTNEQ